MYLYPIVVNILLEDLYLSFVETGSIEKPLYSATMALILNEYTLLYSINEYKRQHHKE